MLFSTYRSAMLEARDVHDPRLRISAMGRLEVRYAPFDHVNRNAKVVLLGITPGAQQANAGLEEARRALREGASEAEILARAKVHASFAGPMRANLVAMLDSIGLAESLGIGSCASFWGQNAELVHFASALRYPVFRDGKNYTGRNPAITGSTFLLEQLRRHTAEELASIPDALVLPLGPSVADACDWLIHEDLLEPSRVAAGLPHPSPASNERIAFFLGRKDEREVSWQVNASRILAGRDAVLAAVRRWTSHQRGWS